MKSLRDIFYLLDGADRRQLLFVSAVAFVGSCLEAGGVGLVIPYLRFVLDPESILRDERVTSLAGPQAVMNSEILILAVSLAVVVFFVAKAAYVVFQWKTIYQFTTIRQLRLARRLLATYLKLPYTFHLQRNTADLIVNATVETSNVFGGVIVPGIRLANNAMMGLGIFAVLFVAEPIAALVGFAFLATVGGMSVWCVRDRLNDLGNIRAEEQARMYQWANQTLNGIREIRVFGHEDYFLDSFEQSGVRYNDSLRKSSLYSVYPRLVLETAVIAAFVSIVVVAYFGGKQGAHILPTLGVFAIAAIRLIPSFNTSIQSAQSIRYYGPSVRKLVAELSDANLPDARGARDEKLAPLRLRHEIRVEDLTYLYPASEHAALSGVNLTIPAGTCVGIVGSSGAGKTTLINLILGLLRPTAGRILVDGQAVQEHIGAWQRTLGYIPQDIYILDDTMRRNIALGVPDEKIDDDAIRACLRAAQLESFAQEQKNGLDTVVGERGVRLSGGQRQRIGIARALYHAPELLILDEATSNLDYETEMSIARAITRLAGQRTAIIVAHRLSTVRHCDAIFVLERGELIDSGSFEELLARNSRFQQMVAAGDLDLEKTAAG